MLIPISFLAIRLADDFIHPTVFTREGPQMSTTMFLTFCSCWAAVTLLAYVLYRVELLGKRIDVDLRELREVAEMSQGQYVAAVYGVVFVVVLAYVAIIAAKLVRIQRQVAELLAEAPRGQAPQTAVRTESTPTT